jgi:hypothetical protein
MKEPERLPKKVVAEILEAQIPDISTFDLTLKEMRFLAAYIASDFNGAEAYHACNSREQTDIPDSGGCTNKSATKQAILILKKDRVQKALSSYMKAFIGEHKDKLEYKILNQLYLRAFYNPFDIITADGSLRPMEDIDKDHQKLIVGIEEQMHPKDPSVRVQRVKLADRDKARKELEVYINMLHVENVQTLKLGDDTKDKLRSILGDVKDSGFSKLPKKDDNPIKALGD